MSVYVFGFLWFWFGMIIFYKYEMPIRIYQIWPSKALDELTNCEFCMEFWLGTLQGLIFCLYYGSFEYLTIGVYYAAISNLFKR